MGITREEAYAILELPYGADGDSVRTSYKRLALKWHPDKHENHAEATKKFQSISLAYKRLTEEDSEDEIELNMSDMFELFQQVFLAARFGFTNGYESSDDDDDDDDEDDDDDDYKYRGKYSGGYNKILKPRLTPEEIERNANELITEEEKEKKKAEKRRAKKKRRKEKKKQEKQETEQPAKSDGKKANGVKTNSTQESKKSKKKDKKNKESSESESETFDASAAFFTKVVNKKLKQGLVPDPKPTSKSKPSGGKSQSKDEDDVEELDPVVLRSRQLAIHGNQMANQGEYTAAIDLFTEAIKLDPADFRFFGNRSYCFDRIHQYDRALKDAEKAVSLQPDWPKGYFRKGRALAGLKLFAEAEQAFMQVLKLDRNCEDAIQELLRVRTHQITEMGFSRHQAEAAIKQYGSVQQALDSLLAGVVAETSLGGGDLYVSDDDDFSPVTPQPQYSPVPHQHAAEVKMNPANPEGLTALWVGNVQPKVNEKKLTELFSKYGTVTSVRLLPEKFCAFINFKTKESAGRAMQGLQGFECAGKGLLIKFPDNPIVNGQTTGSTVIKKPNPTQKR